MRDLSIAQEYLLCVLNGKGKITNWNMHTPICVLASGLLELFMNDIIELDDENKVIVKKDLCKNLDYLELLYNYLANSKPRTVKKIASDYILSFSNKKLNSLINTIGDSLVKLECVEKINESKFLKNKNCFIPKKNEVDKIIQRIRAELLEDGQITEETIALVGLLDKSGHIKKYFSKYESEQLKERLSEIRSTAGNKIIKDMINYIDLIITVVAAS